LGIVGLRGRMTTSIPGRTPCIECLYHRQEESVQVVSVVGPNPGLTATLQVLETLKLRIEFGDPLAGKLVSFDGETMVFNHFDIIKRPECKVCSA
jgi:molybdopterin/thiamine biosynthesis adenylyltransferase